VHWLKSGKTFGVRSFYNLENQKHGHGGIGTQHAHPKRAVLECGKSGPPHSEALGSSPVEEATGVGHCSLSALDLAGVFVNPILFLGFVICGYADFIFADIKTSANTQFFNLQI
jgi:hypothetical protein